MCKVQFQVILCVFVYRLSKRNQEGKLIMKSVQIYFDKSDISDQKFIELNDNIVMIDNKARYSMIINYLW